MGPLSGLKVIELSGLGPGPFCGMMLADMGADVVCIDRAARPMMNPRTDCFRRGKRSVVLDLKSPGGKHTFQALVKRADILIEGFRPGVMEQLGLGPDECMAVNPALVYGRMTGWGQDGPLSDAAGHDINYVSLAGALHAIGRKGEKPVPPLNLVGDFGGGAMFLAFGVICAVLERQKSGKGQVVDAAMTDGTAVLMTIIHSLHAEGRWNVQRGSNLLDGGAPFYDVYETADGKFISIGSIEPQFYQELVEKADLSKEEFGEQNDVTAWPEMKLKLEEVFRSRSRAEWCELMEGSDVCFAPVLDFVEAARHPHNTARGTYIEIGGITQPAPAPRFSRTRPEVAFAPRKPGQDLDAVQRDWGVSSKHEPS